MIFPYHLLDLDNPEERARMKLSLERWNGNQGYSLSGKASILCARGEKGGPCRVETEKGLHEFQTLPGEIVSIIP